MRYLVLSDVHGNAPALDAVLQDAERQTFDEVLFLGDLIGYYPFPTEVVARMRALAPKVVLQGNHDALLLALAAGEDVTRSKEGTLVVEVVRRHLAALDGDAVAYLRAAAMQASGEHWTAVHGAFRSPFEYLTGLEVAAANLPHLATSLGLVGHTHVPRGFVALEDDGGTLWRTVEFRGPAAAYRIPPRARAILNPGSIGQPRDGDPSAAYAVLDVASRRFEVRRVTYDVAAVQRRMRQEGYPASLAARLELGR